MWSFKDTAFITALFFHFFTIDIKLRFLHIPSHICPPVRWLTKTLHSSAASPAPRCQILEPLGPISQGVSQPCITGGAQRGRGWVTLCSRGTATASWAQFAFGSSAKNKLALRSSSLRPACGSSSWAAGGTNCEGCLAH